MRLVLLTAEGRGLALGDSKEGDDGREGKKREEQTVTEKGKRTRTETQETKKQEEGGKATPEVEVKIILREFHLSTRRGVEPRRSENEESGPAFPVPFSPLSVALLLTLLSRPLLFLFSR